MLLQNEELQDLQSIAGRSASSGQSGSHTTRVVDSLRSQLNGTTTSFKSVLEVRRSALQAAEARRGLFANSSDTNGAHATWSSRTLGSPTSCVCTFFARPFTKVTSTARMQVHTSRHPSLKMRRPHLLRAQPGVMLCTIDLDAVLPDHGRVSKAVCVCCHTVPAHVPMSLLRTTPHIVRCITRD
jgi:hypothetical protein